MHYFHRKKKPVDHETKKYNPSGRADALSLPPHKPKKIVNLPGLERDPPKPYTDEEKELETGNLSEMTESETKVALTKAQIKRRRKKAMVGSEGNANTEAKAACGAREYPLRSEDSRASKEKKRITKKESEEYPEEHSSMTSLPESGKKKITDNTFSHKVGNLKKSLCVEAPVETDVTEFSQFIESDHHFTDVDTHISLRHEKKKDEMDAMISKIKMISCDMPDNSQFKNFSDEVGTLRNTTSAIPYPFLASFIRSSPSPSYQDKKFDVERLSRLKLVISLLVDPFCITRNPLRPFKGATVYFTRDVAERLFPREMEGARWKHTSIAENITNQLLQPTEFTAVFGDMTEPMDRDCNFRAMLFRHLPPSILQKEMLGHDTRSLNKMDISHEEYHELISISKKFGRRMTYKDGEPVNALTFMCVPVELNLGEKLVKNLFRGSEEATTVKKNLVSGHVFMWVWLCMGG